MSLFPSPFLAKLQDLKLWQGNYEALLQNKSTEINSASDFDTIEGLSALDSTRSSVDMVEKQIGTPQKIEWDKKVVTPSKPFEQLLEEKLAEDQPVVVPFKQKKPFLKKGTGLIRYRMSYPQNKLIGKTTTKQYVNSTQTTERLKPTNLNLFPRHQNCLKKIPPNNIVSTSLNLKASPLRMPDINMKTKGIWVKVQQNDTTPNTKYYCGFNQEHTDKQGSLTERTGEFVLKNLLPSCPTKSDYLNKSSDKVNPMTVQNIYSKSQLENTEQELRVFEALEERAEHSSFSSTNSSIIRMLSSTPSKSKKSSAVGPIREAFASQKRQLEQVNDVNCQDTIINKVQEINKKQDVLHHFLSNLKYMVNPEEDQIEYRSPITRSKKKLTPDTTFSEQDTNTDTRSPTSSSFYTEFENTFKSSLQSRRNVATNTSFSNKDESIQSCMACQNCDELKKQLNKLMKEIPDIQAEKAKVCDFAKDLEKKRDQLNKEMQKMKNKYEKDIEDLQLELEADKKKFVREKAVFDMYIKESQNRPSKKEREEMCLLKKELVDIKELLKLKETKNGATQARLRNQIKHLEKERDELKTSVENLQKENAKLNASKRVQRPSEVKMLHEINKNLSKLTEETFKKQRSKSNLISPVSSKDNVEKENEHEENEDNEITQSQKINRHNSKNRISLEKTNISTDNELTSTHDSLEKQYENTFGQFNSSETSNKSLNDSKKEKVEIMFPDGSKEVKYSNGNTKIISPDGNFITVRYYNGDIKEISLQKNILKYFYSENSTWHTQFGDGSELLEYASGQKEKKYEDGKKEINCPDGTFITKFPDGAEEILYTDGSKMIKNINGEKILLLPNGQKEIHTKDHKRREYPDGTVKILYVDGTQETRYASGRIRIKDANGALIMDSNDVK